MKKYAWFMIALSLRLTACASDIADQTANVLQADDAHVLMVKNGYPTAWPNQHYGEAFDSFFASPTWKYFVGTKEGPDEDGDGEPDYTEENVDIVEFTGYCTYQDVQVKALLQFTLNTEDSTFEPTYLSFNEVPQNKLMMLNLISTVFNREDDSTDESGGGENAFPDTSTADQEQTEEPAWEDTGTESPEDIPKTAYTDSEGTWAADDEEEFGLADFLGEWEAVDGNYPYMEITPLGGEECHVVITFKFNQIEADGEYDARKGVIMYFDGTYSALGRGANDWTIEEDGCEGWIYYESTDVLRWYNITDDYEQYFIFSGSLLDEMELNEIAYREAVMDGWGYIWDEAALHIGSDPSFYFEEADEDPSLYGGNGNPWDDITINGVTYEMAQKHGWGDAWMDFADHVGTGG